MPLKQSPTCLRSPALNIARPPLPIVSPPTRQSCTCARGNQARGGGLCKSMSPIRQCNIIQKCATLCKNMQKSGRINSKEEAQPCATPSSVHQYNCHPPPQLTSFYLLHLVPHHCHHHQTQQRGHHQAHSGCVTTCGFTNLSVDEKGKSENTQRQTKCQPWSAQEMHCGWSVWS